MALFHLIKVSIDEIQLTELFLIDWPRASNCIDGRIHSPTSAIWVGPFKGWAGLRIQLEQPFGLGRFNIHFGRTRSVARRMTYRNGHCIVSPKFEFPSALMTMWFPPFIKRSEPPSLSLLSLSPLPSLARSFWILFPCFHKVGLSSVRPLRLCGNVDHWKAIRSDLWAQELDHRAGQAAGSPLRPTPRF